MHYVGLHQEYGAAASLHHHDRCDRCARPMDEKIISFFTDEMLCPDCLDREREVVARLRRRDVDLSRLAKCGYVPFAEEPVYGTGD